MAQLSTGIGHGAYGLSQRQAWNNHACWSKARDKPLSFMQGFMTEKRMCAENGREVHARLGMHFAAIFCVVKRLRLHAMGVKDLLSPREKREVVFLVSVGVSCK
jgi:hypothetical protein